jgi:hypothetical protein
VIATLARLVVRPCERLEAPPERDGSMTIFRTREKGSPLANSSALFVANGVVRSWQLREWLEIFGEV